jgi:hypothetical protein
MPGLMWWMAMAALAPIGSRKLKAWGMEGFGEIEPPALALQRMSQHEVLLAVQMEHREQILEGPHHP